MALLAQTPTDQFDSEVLEILGESPSPISFGELEDKVYGRLANARIPKGPLPVRQAAWRLINNGKAELTSDSKIKAI